MAYTVAANSHSPGEAESTMPTISRPRLSRSALLVLLTCGALVCAGRASAQQPTSYIIRPSAAPCLRFRAEPYDSATQLDCLAPGALVEGIDTAPYWRKIRLADGREGWAAKKFLESAPSPLPEPTPSTLPADAWLEVHFVDVGQGDGIWIHTHDDGVEGNGIFEGTNIVIDGGPDSADAKNQMLQYLRQFAHHNAVIDAMIVTHPHDDHYPGAEGILRHFDVLKYYDPGYPKEGIAYPAFLDAVRGEIADGHNAKVMLGRDQFDALDWGGEIDAQVLYTWPGNAVGLGSKNTVENNASIVLRVAYGGHVFLFMGDAEGKDRDDSSNNAQYVEKVLLDTVPHATLKTTVLKVGHHGSETSSTDPFVETVDPDIVVASSGRRKFNTVFLPDATTLRRYCCHRPSTRIYRTDQNDASAGRTTVTDADGDHIVIRTNGTTLEVHAQKDGQPFTVTECQPACTP